MPIRFHALVRCVGPRLCVLVLLIGGLALLAGAQDDLEDDLFSIDEELVVGSAKESTGERLVRFSGKFHPVVIHYPIALLTVAALFELLVWLGWAPQLAPGVRWLLWLAVPGAAVSAGLGWAAAAHGSYPASVEGVLFWHRWLGTGVAGLTLVAAIMHELGARPGAARLRLAYRLLLLATAALVCLVGHFGGILVYGLNHYQW